MLGSAVDQLGLFGLLLALLAHLGYNIYENRMGSVAQIGDKVDDAHRRLDGVGTVLYRQAREEWDEVDEDEIRDMLFNGHEVTFPADFEDTGYYPDEVDTTEPPENQT